MGIETERKFLLSGDGWRTQVENSSEIVQGYLSEDRDACVRVRIVDGRHGWLTVKGKGDGISRPEFEYPVPIGDAREMLALCRGRTVAKRRHAVPAGNGLIWEIDVFSGRHEGLSVAEIELPEADSVFDRPGWIGREVTTDPRFLNQTLACGR